MLFSALMTAFVIYAISIAGGCGLFAFWFFFYYSIFFYYLYTKNNKIMPRKWLIISGSIILIACLGSLIASLLITSFNDFLGFSITYLVFTFLLMGYSFFTILSEYNL